MPKEKKGKKEKSSDDAVLAETGKDEKLRGNKNDKMLVRFLQNVAVNFAGKPAEDMIELLNNKKHVNEFIIAKKLDINVNQVRNILYKLSDHGIVSFIRKKDKRKGWYTYFWRIEPLKSLEVLRNSFKEKIAVVNNQIHGRENNVFYYCERCGIEMNEENALLHNFTCPECGGIFEIRDNSKLLREMKKNLAKYEEELALIEGELRGQEEKREVVKQKERKKEDAKKSAAKKKAQKERKEKRDKEKKQKIKEEKKTKAKAKPNKPVKGKSISARKKVKVSPKPKRKNKK